MLQDNDNKFEVMSRRECNYLHGKFSCPSDISWQHTHQSDAGLLCEYSTACPANVILFCLFTQR